MRALLTVLAVALVAASCESPTAPSCPGPCPNQVRVSNNFFNPSARTVSVGDSVTFFWNSGGTVHNVTFADGPASPDQGSGKFIRQFAGTGVFAYQCTIHGASMSGSVTVN
jgi:plastocyanin